MKNWFPSISVLLQTLFFKLALKNGKDSQVDSSKFCHYLIIFIFFIFQVTDGEREEYVGQLLSENNSNDDSLMAEPDL